jgi:hypothetical protein
MRRGELVAGLGGLSLLVSLFLPWYDDATGWQSMTVIDVLLALLALLALAVPIVSVATRGPAKSIGTAVLASAFGWLAVVLVVIRLIDSPIDGAALRLGAWLGLVGALVAWIGSWLSMRDESTPGIAAPDVPRRPAPPASAA